MAKIQFDKYYTPPTTARWCIEKAYEIIGKDNITEIIEPSAGNGMFSYQIPGCISYDLYPQGEGIIQADFTKLELEYKKGRLFIGNPPFGGQSGKLLTTFYNKCCEYGDYIAFIQPPGFYNNYNKRKKFEIVYSCILNSTYTNLEIRSSFTIYKRNSNKNNFLNIDYTIPCIKFTRLHKSNKVKKHKKVIKNFDHCFVTFGASFKKCQPYEFASTVGVQIEHTNRKEIVKFLEWLYYYEKESNLFK